MRPALISFSGLPGSGKTTIATELARRLGAAYIRIDTIERGLEELCSVKVRGEGYALARRIAADNLRLGLDVVADSVNPWGAHPARVAGHGEGLRRRVPRYRDGLLRLGRAQAPRRVSRRRYPRG